MASLANIQVTRQPVNLTALQAPLQSLAAGSSYLLQNLTNTPISISESAAAPTDESGRVVLPIFGDRIQLTVEAATPPWVWVHAEDGLESTLGITTVTA